MNRQIKLHSMSLKNVKNVAYGEYFTNSDFNNLKKSDVIGFYGQNGSGKTAVVDSLNILDKLLALKSLDDIEKLLIEVNSEIMELNFSFLTKFDNNEFFISYEVEFEENENTKLRVVEEVLSFRENIKGKKSKKLVTYRDGKIDIRLKKFNSLSDDHKVSSKVAIREAERSGLSVIFHDELDSVYEELLNENERTLVDILKFDFSNNLHIIESVDYALLTANILMPFSIYYENIRGKVPIRQDDNLPLPLSVFTLLKESVFPTINMVLPYIIPDLQIEINEIAKRTLSNDEKGVLFEFLAIRENSIIPLSEESEGIKKIISMLSAFMAMFRDPNACIVIDELDSGIFEYLLGELLKILNDNGKGQLIFTSHNLRILETLPIKNIWFTTTNPNNRYIQLKQQSNTSNYRDVYIRALQIKNQNEVLYDRTDNHKIKKAFIKQTLLGNKS
ncbi:AAA family ATPase [Macrococcoides canis]|uniref:AAA family ATPase n=1 Tax=Macrococcoides canis TaxID=1855823 RepID=UPI0013E99980|nr:AAA family ATPase [Macrococcus canis]QIH75696.1 AAA family ATPase [Macrococcus canis]